MGRGSKPMKPKSRRKTKCVAKPKKCAKINPMILSTGPIVCFTKDLTCEYSAMLDALCIALERAQTQLVASREMTQAWMREAFRIEDAHIDVMSRINALERTSFMLGAPAWVRADELQEAITGKDNQ